MYQITSASLTERSALGNDQSTYAWKRKYPLQRFEHTKGWYLISDQCKHTLKAPEYYLLHI